MAYDADKTWADFQREALGHANGIIRAVKLGEELYQDLLVYKGTKTNAEIATALGTTEAAIDDLQAALVSMHQINEFCENSSVTAGNHFDNLRKFT